MAAGSKYKVLHLRHLGILAFNSSSKKIRDVQKQN
jgi:hypothetical protein